MQGVGGWGRKEVKWEEETMVHWLGRLGASLSPQAGRATNTLHWVIEVTAL